MLVLLVKHHMNYCPKIAFTKTLSFRQKSAVIPQNTNASEHQHLYCSTNAVHSSSIDTTCINTKEQHRHIPELLNIELLDQKMLHYHNTLHVWQLPICTNFTVLQMLHNLLWKILYSHTNWLSIISQIPVTIWKKAVHRT